MTVKGIKPHSTLGGLLLPCVKPTLRGCKPVLGPPGPMQLPCSAGVPCPGHPWQRDSLRVEDTGLGGTFKSFFFTKERGRGCGQGSPSQVCEQGNLRPGLCKLRCWWEGWRAGPPTRLRELAASPKSTFFIPLLPNGQLLTAFGTHSG